MKIVVIYFNVTLFLLSCLNDKLTVVFIVAELLKDKINLVLHKIWLDQTHNIY